MVEGTIIRWLVADGDRVEAGSPIYVLETDKVESGIEAVAAGTITLLGEAGRAYAHRHRDPGNRLRMHRRSRR